MNRSIQAEGGFADIKGDSGFTRFLCRGTENVLAEYVLYAMAHNLGWLHSRIQNDKLDLHLYALKEEEKESRIILAGENFTQKGLDSHRPYLCYEKSNDGELSPGSSVIFQSMKKGPCPNGSFR